MINLLSLCLGDPALYFDAKRMSHVDQLVIGVHGRHEKFHLLGEVVAQIMLSVLSLSPKYRVTITKATIIDVVWNREHWKEEDIKIVV